MKVVINACFGGFSLSKAAMLRYAELKGLSVTVEDEDSFVGPSYWLEPDPAKRENQDNFHALSYEERAASNQRHAAQRLYERNILRNDPTLVQVIEELGEAACGSHASLKIVETPDDVKFEIKEYDGYEHVAEVHRIWS